MTPQRKYWLLVGSVLAGERLQLHCVCVCVSYRNLNGSLNSMFLCQLQRSVNNVSVIEEVRTVLKRLGHLCWRLDSTEQVVISSFTVELHKMLDLRAQSHIPVSCTELRILVGVWVCSLLSFNLWLYLWLKCRHHCHVNSSTFWALLFKDRD